VSFKNALNGFCKLKWITSERTKEVISLDLKISINNEGYIEKTTYQKPQNLHLYIPGISAHPDGCLNGTIFGNAIQYWNQNTHITDFTNLMADHALHLKSRGHEMTEIEATMLEAAKRIDGGEKSNNKKRKEIKNKATQKHYIYTGNITHVILRKTQLERLTIAHSWMLMDSTK
jgi:hypothetical protein